MIFVPEESRSHEVGPEINWNESMVLICYDRDSDLSVYFRIAGRPNQRVAEQWVFAAAPTGERFRHVDVAMPYKDGYRRPLGFSAGGLHWDYVGDNVIHLTADYPELQADLRYRDFYAPQNGWQFIGHEHDYGLGQYTAHYECSGSVEGEVTFCGRTYRITAGLAHRDHSWGPRRDETRVARWVIGTIGPDFSHSLVSHIDPNGKWVTGGWIVRNGMVEHARQVDIVAYQNSDGVSARGGQAAAVLESGERVTIGLETRASFISFNGLGDSRACEGVSRSFIGGRPGMACFTIANGATGVGAEVKAICTEYATMADGLTHAPPRPELIGIQASNI